jgi:uncharacterized protein YigE (DUF2233 family)
MLLKEKGDVRVINKHPIYIPMRRLICILGLLLLACWHTLPAVAQSSSTEDFVTYTVDPHKQRIRFYWKDELRLPFRSIGNLNKWLRGKNELLVFAMNGGMYKENNIPLGLFIAQGTEETPLDTSSGDGNFYLKPNGVFYITRDDKPQICTTPRFRNNGRIKYATQSGPMLVTNNQIHPAFKKGSERKNIRNGVGILPGNKAIFVLSKKPLSLYDFAAYFKGLGCRDALYLDGFVSRMYLPEQQWLQEDGDFGLIIGVTRPLER